MTKVKVVVKRVVKPLESPSHFFVIELNGNNVRWFAFKENVDESDIYNEEKNKTAALEFAKKLEAAQIGGREEIIYQTPD